MGKSNLHQHLFTVFSTLYSFFSLAMFFVLFF